MIHGVFSTLSGLGMGAICEAGYKHSDGYTKNWRKVTCPACRTVIRNAGYDFTTATE